jgi:aspartyl-tRNA(Asn)/glutamyl-tRNA(Gln) amidotransferase subunit C
MQIDKEQVYKLAHLARLELTEVEAEKFSRDLTRVLNWIETLREIDTTGVRPLISPVHEPTGWRKDEVTCHLDRTAALQQAPQADAQYFLVPRVIP